MVERRLPIASTSYIMYIRTPQPVSSGNGVQRQVRSVYVVCCTLTGTYLPRQYKHNKTVGTYVERMFSLPRHSRVWTWSYEYNVRICMQSNYSVDERHVHESRDEAWKPSIQTHSVSCPLPYTRYTYDGTCTIPRAISAG